MTRPIPNSIRAMAAELAEWRRDFHRHPELGYEETRTAQLVAERLRAFGFDAVETGIGKTGVLGVLHGEGGPGGDAIMLRADMDALPIEEETGLPYASENPGVMHACGHDGHTTMLLGAARHLAETRNFRGTVYFCFQPAEEGGAGAKAMLEDGLFERYRPRAVYGLHNWPGLPAGHFAVKDGPVLAAAGEFTLRIRGRGGHAAQPHLCRDPIIAGAAVVSALQSVVSRETDPLESAVISVTRFAAGSTHNVIPDEAELLGTLRAFSEERYAALVAAIERVASSIAAAHGVEAEVSVGDNTYPATINDAREADFVESVLRETFGEEAVRRGHAPTMAGEDFSFFAREVPGCYVLIGNGDSAELHSPRYDFRDEIAPIGATWWVRLVEKALPRG